MVYINKNYQVWCRSVLTKKTGLGASVNEELAQQLHKPVIKKFKRRTMYARFKDNIWAAD